MKKIQTKLNTKIINQVRDLLEVFEIKDNEKYISLYELTCLSNVKSRKVSLVDLFSNSNSLLELK